MPFMDEDDEDEIELAYENGEDFYWRCGNCGSVDVQHSYPVWIPANYFDNKDRWDPDYEAQPYKDSDLTYCPACQDNEVAVKCAGKAPKHGEGCDMDGECNCTLEKERELWLAEHRSK